MGRLRRSNCSTPGISRRRAGRGSTYVDALADGKPEKVEAAVLDLLGDAADERAAA